MELPDGRSRPRGKGFSGMAHRHETVLTAGRAVSKRVKGWMKAASDGADENIFARAEGGMRLRGRGIIAGAESEFAGD